MNDGLFHVAAKSCIILTKLQLTSSCQSAILGVVNKSQIENNILLQIWKIQIQTQWKRPLE